MRRWIREVWPSPGVLVFIAFIYVLMAILPQWIYRAFGGTGIYADGWQPAIACLCVYSVVYGAYRVLGFHPRFHGDYLAWLRQTPWTYEKPLPGGPLHLVSQDVVFVSILAGLAWLHHPWFAFLIPILFFISQIVFWGFSFPATNHWKHAYLIAFGLSGLLPLGNSLIGLPIVVAVLYAITLHGIRGILRSFEEWNGRNEPVASLFAGSNRKNDKLLGWPYDRLAPRLSIEGPTFGWSVALSVLVAWWVSLLVTIFGPHESAVPMLACLFAGVCAMIRAAVYLSGHSNPLGLRARILTGRMRFPGYDIVYLAPALILLLAGSVYLCTLLGGLPYSISASLICGGSLMIALKCPPGINEWKLTGKHRIEPGLILSASEMLQTQ